MAEKTAVVLLPGLDGTGALFEPFVACAPSDFDPLVVPLPHTANYRELARAIQNTLPDKNKNIIIGESFSGPLALLVASTLHDRSVGVVLCNSFVERPRAAIFRLLPWSLILGVPLPRLVAARYFLGTSAFPNQITALRCAIAKTPVSVLAARVRAILSVDVGDLSSFTSPVLYLRGTSDRLIPRSASQAVARILPNVQIVELDGPHLLLQVAPERAWEHIKAFAIRERLMYP